LATMTRPGAFRLHKTDAPRTHFSMCLTTTRAAVTGEAHRPYSRQTSIEDGWRKRCRHLNPPAFRSLPVWRRELGDPSTPRILPPPDPPRSWFQGVGTYIAQRGRVVMAEAPKHANSIPSSPYTPGILPSSDLTQSEARAGRPLNPEALPARQGDVQQDISQRNPQRRVRINPLPRTRESAVYPNNQTPRLLTFPRRRTKAATPTAGHEAGIKVPWF
jgi:hypothetical protein